MGQGKDYGCFFFKAKIRFMDFIGFELFYGLMRFEMRGRTCVASPLAQLFFFLRLFFSFFHIAFYTFLYF